MVASRQIATLIYYFTVKKKVCDLKIDNISYLPEGAVTTCFSESTVKRSLEFVSDLAPRGAPCLSLNTAHSFISRLEDALGLSQLESQADC